MTFTPVSSRSTIRDGKLVGHCRRFDNRLLFAARYGKPATRYARVTERE